MSYLSKLSPTVGGGLGGLPERRGGNVEYDFSSLDIDYIVLKPSVGSPFSAITSSYSLPSDAKMVQFIVVGAGGSGAVNISTTSPTNSSAGGGGCCVSPILEVKTYNFDYRVAGATQGKAAGSTGNGLDGSYSSVTYEGNTYLANGGVGGKSSYAVNAGGTATGGLFNNSGGQGGYISLAGGTNDPVNGGGGAGGVSSNGGNGGQTTKTFAAGGNSIDGGTGGGSSNSTGAGGGSPFTKGQDGFYLAGNHINPPISSIKINFSDIDAIVRTGTTSGFSPGGGGGTKINSSTIAGGNGGSGGIIVKIFRLQEKG